MLLGMELQMYLSRKLCYPSGHQIRMPVWVQLWSSENPTSAEHVWRQASCLRQEATFMKYRNWSETWNQVARASSFWSASLSDLCHAHPPPTSPQPPSSPLYFLPDLDSFHKVLWFLCLHWPAQSFCPVEWRHSLGLGVEESCISSGLNLKILEQQGKRKCFRAFTQNACKDWLNQRAKGSSQAQAVSDDTSAGA